MKDREVSKYDEEEGKKWMKRWMKEKRERDTEIVNDNTRYHYYIEKEKNIDEEKNLLLFLGEKIETNSNFLK